MTVQCVFCHRIRYGSTWKEGKAEEGVISFIACPRCVAKEREKGFQAQGGLTDEEQIEEAKRSGF
jgi:hypothetical protein